MNRRKFFGFLPSAAVTGASSVAAVLAAPVRAEDVQGITVTDVTSVIIHNCVFHTTPENPQPCITVVQRGA